MSSSQKRQIAKDFKELRRLLGMTPREVVENSNGTLRRAELHKVEHELSLVSTVAKRRSLAAGFGLPMKAIALLAEQRIGPAEAAKYSGKSDADVPYPDGDEPAPPARGADDARGDKLAILSRLEHAKKSPFPLLELTLIYHEADGKRWRDTTIAVARTGQFGESDKRPSEWRAALDSLEETLEEARRRYEAAPRKDHT